MHADNIGQGSILCKQVMYASYLCKQVAVCLMSILIQPSASIDFADFSVAGSELHLV